MKYKTTIILHSNEEKNQPVDEFKQTIQSIANQINHDFDVTILGAIESSTSNIFKDKSIETAGTTQ